MTRHESQAECVYEGRAGKYDACALVATGPTSSYDGWGESPEQVGVNSAGAQENQLKYPSNLLGLP